MIEELRGIELTLRNGCQEFVKFVKMWTMPATQVISLASKNEASGTISTSIFFGVWEPK